MGFNSSWGTVDSDSESGEDGGTGEENDDDEDKDGVAAREASLRLQVNTQLNSRTMLGGPSAGSPLASPMPMTASPGGAPTSMSLAHSMLDDNPGPKVNNNIQIQIHPQLASGSATHIDSAAWKSNALPHLPHTVHPASPLPTTPGLSSLPEVEHASGAGVSRPSPLSGHPVLSVSVPNGRLPPTRNTPISPLPGTAASRAQSLPTSSAFYSYTQSAPATRRSSPVAGTSPFHVSASPIDYRPSPPPSTSASSPPVPSSHDPGKFAGAVSPIPQRPYAPVRSSSSGSFLNAVTPRVRSRRRNASGNRISLVAGRRVPLPFDPTTPIDPLPPLIVRTSTPTPPLLSPVVPDNDREGDLPVTSLSSYNININGEISPNRLTRQESSINSIAADNIQRSPSPSTIMPFIAPLLHPRGEPPSRIPSVSSVPGPSRGDFERPTGDNDGTITPTSSYNLASPLTSVPSTPTADHPSLSRSSSTLSRSSSKRSHSHKKSRSKEKDSTVIAGGRSVDDFVILGEAGRGAYGLVKRVREKMPDGSLGVRPTRLFHSHSG